MSLPERAATLVDAFASLRVTVVGDAMLDEYLEGSADRVCREAPVPVISVSGREEAPGGAANAAAAVAALGASVELVAAVGADADGERIFGLLRRRGVGIGGMLRDGSRRTIAKRRLAAGGQMVARIDEGTTAALAPELERALLAHLGDAIERSDAVIVSDYGAGTVTDAVVDALAAMQRSTPRLLVADARRLDRYRDVGATVATPSYEDAMDALGGAGGAPRATSERDAAWMPASGRGDAARDRAEHAVGHAERLLDLARARLTVVTLDRDGALLLERGRPPHRTYARHTGVAGSAGAGDTFAAALALALAAGAETTAAVEVGSAAASVAVSKPGTSSCSADELRIAFAPGGKLVDRVGSLRRLVAAHREAGRRIVFTNGCFDIIHRGHIAYLNEAKSRGDVLVVGVNSDASVGRLKGPGRPLNRLAERAEVLAALSCVDHIVPFTGDQPVDLIEAVRPEVYAKGGDYTELILPEAPLVERLGGEVAILPYVRDRSTSRILHELRARRAAGAGVAGGDGDTSRPAAAPGRA